ncbi:MAG: hypothetical protein PHV06_02475 [bacterium]|nr:hypothetical protein [bacterium]
MLNKKEDARRMIPIVSKKHRDVCASLVAGLNRIKKRNIHIYLKIMKIY